MRRILILATIAGLLGGCSEALPAGPDAAPRDEGALSSVTMNNNQTRSNALDGIEDAQDRIVPGLSDGTAARPIDGALGALRNAMLHADASAIPPLIAAASQAVDRYGRANLDGAELDAIRLALDYAAEVLTH